MCRVASTLLVYLDLYPSVDGSILTVTDPLVLAREALVDTSAVGHLVSTSTQTAHAMSDKVETVRTCTRKLTTEYVPSSLASPVSRGRLTT